MPALTAPSRPLGLVSPPGILGRGARFRRSGGRRGLAVVTAGLTLMALAACAPQEEKKADTSTGSDCTTGALKTHKQGVLKVGTDTPAYAPWFSGNDPSNGKGFESAVAYAVADQLGYQKDAVQWVTVPFNNAIAPGPKAFDFDINQVSISHERSAAVDLTTGYYSVHQALVALKSSKIANATTIKDLRKAKLGAQVGTTSLDVLNDVIKPDGQPSVFQKNDLAKSALKNGQVDGIIVDLPTAFFITSAEVPEATVVGQFQQSGPAEQFGLVLDKGSTLTSCVAKAVDALREDGTLARLEKEWLADAVNAPVLK